MKKTLFQIVLIGGLIFFVILAVLIFSGLVPTPGGSSKKQVKKLSGEVVIWGTIEQSKIAPVLDALGKSNLPYSNTYIEKRPENFENDLINAIASNKGPDIIIIDPGLLVKHADKLYPTGYKTFSERDYSDTFVDAANLYLTPDGILAFPISVDPLVLYYNKDILAQNSIVKTPEYWNEFVTLAKVLTQVDEAGVIRQSMIPLGEFDNITHAKDIVALLSLQLGNPIVQVTKTYDKDQKVVFAYESVFGNQNKDGVRVGDSVMRFYTQFADPAKEVYSWNKSFQNDKSAFLTGKTAFYIGYASEYNEIIQKNPNLNFDISRIPQVKDASFIKTYANVLGAGVIANSKNPDAAFNTVDLLIGQEFAAIVTNALGTAPARKDLLSVKQESSYGGIVYPSAIISASWYDPNEEATNKIFRNMVVSIVSGRNSIGEAVQTFVADIKDVLP